MTSLNHILERLRCGRRPRGGTRRGTALLLRRSWYVIFSFCIICLIVLQWMLSITPPEYSSPTAWDSCASVKFTSIDDYPYVLQDEAVCSSACGRQCFPRLRDLCIWHDVVTVCNGGDLYVPSHLRFSGKDQYWRRNVPIKRGVCGAPENSLAVWIRGTQMVADMKMMPNGHRVGPSPHHEAEKLIPAILLSAIYGLNGSSLYWFTDPVPSVTSVWSLGLMDAFADELDVKFFSVPKPRERPICFEDAVLFSGVTNAGYVPNTVSNDWLREKVLAHCKIRSIPARKPPKDVVIVNRLNSSRAIKNVDEVAAVLKKELGVPVKQLTSGVGGFCDQVKVAAEADLLVTSHGSHNVNSLFARPGTIVLEAFPLLYYLDWFRNYLHSARLKYHELFGTWPTEEKGAMPFRMAVYALLFGWQDCFYTRQCMNYAKSQNIFVNLHQLQRLLAIG